MSPGGGWSGWQRHDAPRADISGQELGFLCVPPLKDAAGFLASKGNLACFWFKNKPEKWLTVEPVVGRGAKLGKWAGILHPSIPPSLCPLPLSIPHPFLPTWSSSSRGDTGELRQGTGWVPWGLRCSQRSIPMAMAKTQHSCSWPRVAQRWVEQRDLNSGHVAPWGS